MTDQQGLLRNRPLYNFDGVEFVEIKHADWQEILERARSVVITEDDGSREPIPNDWRPPTRGGVEGAGEPFAQIADWCATEREKIGAVDGYDYRSGEEFGLRRAQLESERRHRAAPPKPAPEIYWPQDAPPLPHPELLGPDGMGTPSQADKRQAFGVDRPEPDAMVARKACSDWAFNKEGEAIGYMLPQQAAREAFFAGAKWWAALSSAPVPPADGADECDILLRRALKLTEQEKFSLAAVLAEDVGYDLVADCPPVRGDREAIARAKALADELAKIKAFPETFSRTNHDEIWRVSLGIRDRSDRDLIVSALLAF